MGRGAALLLGSLLALGCVTYRATSLANHERAARTGLEKGDAVAALVVAVGDCRDAGAAGEPCAAGPPAPEVAERIEVCLRAGLGKTPLHSARTLLPAPPDPAEPGALRGWLASDEVRARGVRYLLVVRAETTEGGFPTGGMSGLGWMIGRHAQRNTRIDVDVHDAWRDAPVGKVTAKGYGPAGRGVFFLFNFVPMPLVEDARTEAEACRAAAKQLLRFLEDPEPRDWLPES